MFLASYKAIFWLYVSSIVCVRWEYHRVLIPFPLCSSFVHSSHHPHRILRYPIEFLVTLPLLQFQWTIILNAAAPPRGAAQICGRRAPPAGRGRTGRRPCLVPSTSDECDADRGGGERRGPRPSIGHCSWAAAGARRRRGHRGAMLSVVWAAVQRTTTKWFIASSRSTQSLPMTRSRTTTGAMTATARFPFLPHNR